MPEEFNFSNFINVQEPLNDITKTCFNWCQEQAIIFQGNIDISNLGVVAVAMIALLLYNISIEWSDEICNSTRLSKDTLRIYGHIIVFFAFMLLALFLGYYTWFN